MHTTKAKHPRTGERKEHSMRNAYALRNEFELHEYNTAITKDDFEKHFTRTTERVRYTFNGWESAVKISPDKNVKKLWKKRRLS